MFFSKPIAPLPKITAPTAAEICAQSKPSPAAQALLTLRMTPSEYFQVLEQHKLSVDSVHFLAHGLPEKDAICWACQGVRATVPKLSAPEMEALHHTEAWLKNPTPELRASVAGSLKKVDYTGPGSWAAQAAMWAKVPGAPPAPVVPGFPVVNLTAAAVAGSILLASGLKLGPPMPAVPKPKVIPPTAPLPPAMLPQVEQSHSSRALKFPPVPQAPPVPKVVVPVVDQPKMMKQLAPFLDLGKGVASGTVRCC